MGLNIWFDAVDGIFEIVTETHGDCRPKKQARFAFQDAKSDTAVFRHRTGRPLGTDSFLSKLESKSGLRLRALNGNCPEWRFLKEIEGVVYHWYYRRNENLTVGEFIEQ